MAGEVHRDGRVPPLHVRPRHVRHQVRQRRRERADRLGADRGVVEGGPRVAPRLPPVRGHQAAPGRCPAGCLVMLEHDRAEVGLLRARGEQEAGGFGGRPGQRDRDVDARAVPHAGEELALLRCPATVQRRGLAGGHRDHAGRRVRGPLRAVGRFPGDGRAARRALDRERGRLQPDVADMTGQAARQEVDPGRGVEQRPGGEHATEEEKEAGGRIVLGGVQRHARADGLDEVVEDFLIQPPAGVFGRALAVGGQRAGQVVPVELAPEAGAVGDGPGQHELAAPGQRDGGYVRGRARPEAVHGTVADQAEEARRRGDLAGQARVGDKREHLPVTPGQQARAEVERGSRPGRAWTSGRRRGRRSPGRSPAGPPAPGGRRRSGRPRRRRRR